MTDFGMGFLRRYFQSEGSTSPSSVRIPASKNSMHYCFPQRRLRSRCLFELYRVPQFVK